VFVDRERELERLRAAWESGRAELLIVYGRRRVGKTTLLRHFLADRPHTYWVATMTADELLRRSFTEALWRTAHPDGSAPGFTYDDWVAALGSLADQAQSGRHAVVIDEYPYLAGAQPGVSSILQKVWDEQLQHTRFMLVLCGSSIGMMEREALEYRAPLYGRRTGQLRLGPLPVRAAAALLPRYEATDAITAYGVLGGIPAYLRLFDDRVRLTENIERHILDPDGYLHSEPEFLLREELREPRNYFGILQAIAGGRTRLNEIAQITGLERTAASRYLATLRDLRLVERRVPITETQPEKSRKGIYRLSDPFLRFWFRFVGPCRSVLESGVTGPAARQVAEALPQFTGPAFEDLCRAWVAERAAAGALPVAVERIGSWWARDREVDIVAVGGDAILIGECKWSARPVGVSVLDELERAAEPLVAQFPNRRVVYALFARTGFSPKLREVAKARGVLLVSAERLLEMP